jgi:transposase
MRRAQVLLHSAQGFAPPKIADLLGLSVEWVRHIIKDFNKKGFKALDPKPPAGGRPRKFDDEIRLEMVNLALTPPRDAGYPFQQWSLRRLRKAIIEKEIVDYISISNLRIIMNEEMLAYQVVKTWKESKDPDFMKKKKRVDRLTRKRHNPPVVISFDEMGPLELRPVKGKHWQRSGHPKRVPATYSRNHGVRQFLLAFNYYHGSFFGRMRRHKTGKEIFSFFKDLRRHYPREQRIFIIQDNFRAQWTPTIVAWAKKNKITLVATPTNASWLNPIECHIEDIKDLALTGTDYDSWTVLNGAIQDALRYKNARRAEMLRERAARRKRKRKLWRLRVNA